jgi:putative cardiolipin synthase
VLVDDGETVAGDERVLALSAHDNIEVRVFNPFAYRGYNKMLRAIEFLFNARRLDYRMHNKLLVVDNSVALIGGRNIGNQYFQIDPTSQFADDDVFAAGPIAVQLSATFDEYWNNRMSIPAQALGSRRRTAALQVRKAAPPPKASAIDEADYKMRIASDEPYAGMTSGRLPLVWANAEVVCDSPDRKVQGAGTGEVVIAVVRDNAKAVQSELVIVTPFLVPAADDLHVLQELRSRNVRVRILTNSLESSPEPAAQAGYRHRRVPMLKDGMELYEVRSMLGNTQGSGQNTHISRYGNYSLHAKLYIFDRQKVFIGSMNFDQRSKRINTESGLIIDSQELSQQAERRFEAMTSLENCYEPIFRPRAQGRGPAMVWRTIESGEPVEYLHEPARSVWQRLKVWLLALLPIGREL